MKKRDLRGQIKCSDCSKYFTPFKGKPSDPEGKMGPTCFKKTLPKKTKIKITKVKVLIQTNPTILKEVGNWQTSPMNGKQSRDSARINKEIIKDILSCELSDPNSKVEFHGIEYDNSTINSLISLILKKKAYSIE